MPSFTISTVESRASEAFPGSTIPQPSKKYYDTLKFFGIVSPTSRNKPMFHPDGKHKGELKWVVHTLSPFVFTDIPEHRRQAITDLYSVQLWRSAWETVAFGMVEKGLSVDKMNDSDVIRIVVYHLEAEQFYHGYCLSGLDEADNIIDLDTDEILHVGGSDLTSLSSSIDVIPQSV